MSKSFNFYKSHNDKGTWGLQSPYHQKIVALSVELEKLMGWLKISDQLCNKLKQVQKRRQGHLKKRDPNDTKRNNKNRKDRQATVQHQQDTWKFIEPKAGKPKHTKVDRRDFYWCSNHAANGMWCRHKLDNEHCNVLKCKHQLKDSTNIVQVAIDSDNDQTSQQNDSLYNELMDIIKTEI